MWQTMPSPFPECLCEGCCSARHQLLSEPFQQVGERQRLTDTTIISDSWTTFYVVIAKGYSWGRSQAERRKKARERSGGGDARESDDGLIECSQIFHFLSELVWGDRSPQERNDRERNRDNRIEKMRRRGWDIYIKKAEEEEREKR